MRTLTALLVALTFLSTFSESHAIILYGKDNSQNQADPGTGVPWANVGRVTDSEGNLNDPSVVYLGNRFVLTANHVDPKTHVTFDGSSIWAVEEGSAQQVAPNVDLKIFRLVEDPGLPSLLLYEEALGVQDLSRNSVVVGWGRGRDPGVAVNSGTVPWGGDATTAKRWGTNTTLGSLFLQPYQDGTYQSLRTQLSDRAGPDEAGMAQNDSGGALFQLIDGNWYLAGIATAVQGPGNSVFSSLGISASGDINVFVRIAPYSEQIYAAIPEPSTWALLAGFAALALVIAVRRLRC
jgi:hypothetical protein